MKKFYSIIFFAIIASSVINAQSFPWSGHTKGSKSSVHTQGNISRTFNLTGNGTESNYPQYNNIKGIHKVKLTTAFVATEELKNTVIAKLKSEAGLKQVELELAINEELVGGFVLEYDNKLVDASILRDLKDITKQFKQNVYLYNIR